MCNSELTNHPPFLLPQRYEKKGRFFFKKSCSPHATALKLWHTQNYLRSTNSLNPRTNFRQNNGFIFFIKNRKINNELTADRSTSKFCILPLSRSPSVFLALSLASALLALYPLLGGVTVMSAHCDHTCGVNSASSRKLSTYSPGIKLAGTFTASKMENWN